MLLVPDASINYSSQLRYCYDRFCDPFCDELIRAVETRYAQCGMHSSSPCWLHARIDLPESPSSTETLPTKRNISPDSSPHDSQADAHEDDEYPRYPEATRAAIRARMNANDLEPSEMRHQLFHSRQSHLLRLDLRNHIVRLWYRDTSKRLYIHTALKSVPLPYHDLGTRVFTFLECTGVINFGAIPIDMPITLRQSLRVQRKKHVAIIGAGITGLIAARQLRSFGLDVSVFEARNRPGGRISTDLTNFSAPVDLGAMIITGVIQNPVAVLAEQTKSEMHLIGADCPIFDTNGKWVPRHADIWAESEYNSVLAATARYRMKESSAEKAEFLSLGEAFHKSFLKRVKRRKEHILKLQREACQRFLKGPEKSKTSNDNENRDYTVSNPCESNGHMAIVDEETTGDEDFDSLGVSPPGKRKRTSTGSKSVSAEKKRRSSGSRSPARVSSRTGASGPDLWKNNGSQVITESSDEKQTVGAVMVHPRDDGLVSRLLRWHIANLEYACAGAIDTVSLKHWDQDDPYAFDGDHVLLKTGFGPLVDALMEGLERNVQFEVEVTGIQRSASSSFVSVEWNDISNDAIDDEEGVSLTEDFDAVLVTVPLGVLKTNSIKFSPPLPPNKREAINRLGTGGLMKVAIEFSEQFWVDSDMFGALRESVEKRGAFYCFWNMTGCLGKPILLGMVAEPYVQVMEELEDEEIVKEAMVVLRRCYPDAPDPVAHSVTRWLKDRFSKGAYTNIPVGSTGDDYDQLAAPVEPFLYFAGEHTCRTNPTTCASGIISGLREAHRIVQKFGMIEGIAEVHASRLQASIVESDRNGDGDGDGVRGSTDADTGEMNNDVVVVVDGTSMVQSAIKSSHMGVAGKEVELLDRA